MRFLSVCSGIEAASVAWGPLGWRAWAFAEIEAFPSAVLAHHYPNTPNLGDMTAFKDWPDATVDLLCGGTPCQSFSAAGLRAGLDDPRGQLMLTFGAIAARYRPRWLVWENVPGVLSSNGGRDFGSFLGLLGHLGYGFAYRVLDAQFVRVDGYGRAVPQRRQRVFVVGCLGDWRSAAAVLLERESLRGDPAPRRSAGARVAACLTRGAESSGRGGYAGRRQEDDVNIVAAYGGNNTSGPRDVASALSALSAHGGACGRMDFETETFVAHTLRGEGFDAGEDGTGRGTPLVPVGVDGYNGLLTGDVACTMGTRGSSETASGPTLLVPFDTTQITSANNYSSPKAGDPCHPLAAGAHAPAVAFGWQNAAAQGMPVDTISPTLDKSKHPAALCDTLQPLGITQGISHARPQETHAAALLRTLRNEVGEEAFAQWGLGILGSLQSPEVLRSGLHGARIRPAAFSRSWVVHCALSRSQDGSDWLLQSLREAGCQRCASQGWQPPEQLARQLGAYLSELSQPGAQPQRFMRDLWLAAEGAGLLREALSAVQEVGRPIGRQAEPAQRGAAVRRLTPWECEFLQGFPRGYTAIPWRGKPASECPDGPRYKALGNSWAVNCARWIGRRISLVESIHRNQREAA